MILFQVENGYSWGIDGFSQLIVYLNCATDNTQGGVTPIDSIVTAATALSQRSTVKPSE